MKYVVEVCHTNRNEWSEETEDYREAVEFARGMSKLACVSETRIYDGDEIVAVYVDGKYQDECEDWDEPYDPFDEVGYDPYAGGYDMDL